jgi:hypothetical protein
MCVLVCVHARVYACMCVCVHVFVCVCACQLDANKKPVMTAEVKAAVHKTCSEFAVAASASPVKVPVFQHPSNHSVRICLDYPSLDHYVPVL